MQRAYIGKLMELAERDRNVLHILADSGTGFDEMFRGNFPEQMYNFGIAEEDMVAAAAGMATFGKIPFVYTAGAFLAYRSYEFIRDDVCFQNLNVKIVGMGSGLAWSSLGPSHHTTEEIGVLRSLPNLMILSPATPIQVGACVEAAYEHKGPVYIRIGMNNEEEYFDEGYRLSFGPEVIREGSHVTVFSTGSILEEVMDAVEKIRVGGTDVRIVNVPVLKPFCDDCIKRFAKDSNTFVTVEEHNIIGGLGTVIADTMADIQISRKLIRIGLEDCFATGYGTQKSVRKQNGLSADNIYKRIKECL